MHLQSHQCLIDYIIVKQRDLNNVKAIQVMQRSDCRTDCQMICLKLAENSVKMLHNYRKVSKKTKDGLAEK